MYRPNIYPSGGSGTGILLDIQQVLFLDLRVAFGSVDRDTMAVVVIQRDTKEVH